jgi:endonuclease/exonuclease/phosphatase family metal-dependent hydrolase
VALADNLSTYGDNHRLDWILISRELEFIVYQVLPDKLSDHLICFSRTVCLEKSRCTEIMSILISWSDSASGRHLTRVSKKPLFNYGTAILSRWPVAETLAYNFKPSPPTVNKGFLLTRVKWRPDAESDQEINIDIISVHLDFSRQTVREKQIAEIRELLIARDNPLIILGDFNSDWFTEKSVIKMLAEKGELQVYKPLADNLSTYGDNHRLDWILISRELEFIVYQVLPDKLSDHLMLVADIQLKNTQAIDK